MCSLQGRRPPLTVGGGLLAWRRRWPHRFGRKPRDWIVDACDVVIVPDFQRARAAIFEARTLLFLASWMENAGDARRFPLHLACIGAPPQRVRRMAERCGASITIHEPVGADFRGMSNKLRGLEIEGRHDCVLLLDTDIVVLADLGPVAKLGRRLALAPVTRASLPFGHWETIYHALGASVPEERVTSVKIGRAHV